MSYDYRWNRPAQDAALRRQQFGPVRPMHEPGRLARFLEKVMGR